MDQDREKDLFGKYPEIFQKNGENALNAAVGEGLCIGNGWAGLIDVLCGQITGPLRNEERRMAHLNTKLGQPLWGNSAVIVDQKMLDEQLEKIKALKADIPVAAQVKEKFGGLRFYVDGGTPNHQALINFAESLSNRMCEDCGAMHNVMTYTMGWNRTLCPMHADLHYGDELAHRFRERHAQANFNDQTSSDPI